MEEDYNIDRDCKDQVRLVFQISYQAIDNAGNIESENTIVVKLEEILSGNGGDLFMIVTISSISGGLIIGAVVIYFLVRRKRKA